MSHTIHKTKGIVLRCTQYGDTSVIVSIYTELFGIQSYLVKGVRKISKKGNNTAVFFMPASILDLQVYHNELKQLQFIKEFQWGYLYRQISFDVIKNAVAMFAVELLQHSLKQPEANADLFYFIEDCFKQLDESSATTTANFPLYFSLKLGEQLGFGIQGSYSEQTPVLDLQEGFYTNELPLHPYFIEKDFAELTSRVLAAKQISHLDNLGLNQKTRRQLLDLYMQYFMLHITNFTALRSLEVLKEVLE